MLADFVTLGAFMVALGMLIVGLFAWLRQDIRELRREIGSLRDETSGRMDSLRDETSGRMDSLRDGGGSPYGIGSGCGDPSINHMGRILLGRFCGRSTLLRSRNCSHAASISTSLPGIRAERSVVSPGSSLTL